MNLIQRVIGGVLINIIGEDAYLSPAPHISPDLDIGDADRLAVEARKGFRVIDGGLLQSPTAASA